MGAFCGSYSGISNTSASAAQMSIRVGQRSQRFRGDCRLDSDGRWLGGVVWGLALALLAWSGNRAWHSSYVGLLQGVGFASHVAKPLLLFPVFLCR